MSASPFPPLGPVNLPLPILAHASTLVGLGLYLIFRAPTPLPPLAPNSHKSTTQLDPQTTKSTPANPLAIPSGRGHEISSVLGLATVGLGLAYHLTSYVEVERNQLLYASVPTRLILAGLATVLLLVRGNAMSIEGGRELWGLVVYDAVSVVVLGWWLGEGGFSGRARIY